jgi:hypothetical protein
MEGVRVSVLTGVYTGISPEKSTAAAHGLDVDAPVVLVVLRWAEGTGGSGAARRGRWWRRPSSGMTAMATRGSPKMRQWRSSLGGDADGVWVRLWMNQKHLEVCANARKTRDKARGSSACSPRRKRWRGGGEVWRPTYLGFQGSLGSRRMSRRCV